LVVDESEIARLFNARIEAQQNCARRGISRGMSNERVTSGNNESNEKATAESLLRRLIRMATSFQNGRPAKSRFADRGRFGTAA